MMVRRFPRLRRLQHNGRLAPKQSLAASFRCRPGVECLEDRLLLTIYTVTSTADSGTGTLRQAIMDANNNMGTDTIKFNIAGSGVHTIAPTTALPTIQDAVILDGTSQPGYTSTPLIEINGANITLFADGLDISAGGTTVKGLAINGFTGSGISLFTSGNDTIAGDFLGTDPTGTSAKADAVAGLSVTCANNTIGGTTATARNLISGNTVFGIQIFGTSATGNLVEGNYVGTDATGTVALANGTLSNGGDGILVNGKASKNTIGGTTVSARNLVSGNIYIGIQIADSGTNSNKVEGNYVGTDVNGTAALANAGDGILVNNGAANTTVGGTTTSARNLVSGNGGIGVQVDGMGTKNTRVEANYIGTDITGTKGLANASDGVLISGKATNTTVGGTAAGNRNLISGNTGHGAEIFGSGTTANLVEGNYIGTDVTGTVEVANQGDGVFIDGGAASNTIGGTATAALNLISGNGGIGVQIYGANQPGTSNNLIEGNYIGTDLTGTKALGNVNDGVLIDASATSNTIGGSATGALNLISGNSQLGVQLTDPGTNSNVVQGNYIGTDITGKVALGNASDGVFLNNQASSNLIGTNGDGVNDAAERNIVSGNGSGGMVLIDSGTNSNTIAGNYIGTDVTGQVALGNGTVNAPAGIAIFSGPQSTRIGAQAGDTDTVGEGNLISGNAGDGIYITDSGTNGTVVNRNLIGTDVAGTHNLGNGHNGIYILNGAQSSVVGSPGLGNTIAFNGQAGVLVTDAGSTGNSIRANSIFSNGGLGIDLGASGVQFDHGGSTTGPNNLQNYPVITAATAGSTTTVSGSLNAVASTTYVLDFYANPGHDISYYGPGTTYLGNTTVATDSKGNATFTNVPLSTMTSAGQWITATATDPNGNTSEFSGDRQLPFTLPVLSTTAWTSLGPSPIAQSPDFTGPVMSGRVVFGMPDPTNNNVMYLEADGGGVWKTTDWQDPSPIWTPLTDTQKSSFTGYTTYHGLAFFKGSTNIVYAVAQGPGGGVLKSTNGGSTWTLLGNSVFNQASLGSIAVDPNNSNNLYVSVLYGTNGYSSGGVYKSTDGGKTWTDTTVSKHNGAATDVVMDPMNSSILFAGLVLDTSTPANNGIYESTDAGMTWNLLSNGVLSGANVGAGIRLAIAPSDHNTVYATIYNLSFLGNPGVGYPDRYVTTNGGGLWSELPRPMRNNQPDQDGRTGHTLLTVDPHNSQIVYINGDHTVYQSTDGGSTWMLLNEVEDPNAGFFDNSGNFILVGDHGIYLTGATPSTFVNKQGNLQTSEFYTITLDPNNPNVVYGIAQDQFQPLKYNGYPVWTAMALPAGVTDGTGETGKILVSPANSNRLYDYVPANKSTFILRSDDGGATWVDMGAGIDTSQAGFLLAYASQKAFVMDPKNADRLIVGTNMVYETINDGQTWTSITGNLPTTSYVTALAIAPSAKKTIYAATADGHLYVTINDGGSWAEIDSGLPVDTFDQIGAIQINPNNSQRVYIAATGSRGAVFGPLHVWQTTNGGTNWTSITGNLPSTTFVTDLVVDWRFSTPVLYAGTARGVYRSLNKGTSWSLFGTGLPHAQVYDMQLQANQNILAVGTFGRGAYEISVPGPAVLPGSGPPASPAANAPSLAGVVALESLANLSDASWGTLLFAGTQGRPNAAGMYALPATELESSPPLRGAGLQSADSHIEAVARTMTDTAAVMAMAAGSGGSRQAAYGLLDEISPTALDLFFAQDPIIGDVTRAGAYPWLVSRSG
jgi:hypothetical protein